MTYKIIKADIFKFKVSNKTNWLFTRLQNNNGFYGWGEATLQGKEFEIFEKKNFIFQVVLNSKFKTPFDLKSKLPFNNIVEASISSSIMQCLWDIYAREKEQSIGQMFSDTKNNHVSIYANFNRSTIKRDLKSIETKLCEVIKDGFNAIKFAPFDEVEPEMSFKEMMKNMQPGLERIDTIHNNIDKNIKLMIDCHWRFSFDAITEIIKECEKYNLYWIESPIEESIENIHALKKIKKSLNNRGIKLAGLENQIMKNGFFEFVKNNTHDVMMPDIKYSGGPDEMIELNKFFSKHNIEFSPHNPSGPIAHAHSIQICSVSTPCLLEYQYKESDKFDSIMNISNTPIINSKVRIASSEKGLGVSINMENLLKDDINSHKTQ